MVAGEGPPGTIGAMQARSKPDDHDAWPRGSEGGHRARPVAVPLAAHLREEPGQARAAGAARVEGNRVALGNCGARAAAPGGRRCGSGPPAQDGSAVERLSLRRP